MKDNVIQARLLFEEAKNSVLKNNLNSDFSEAIESSDGSNESECRKNTSCNEDEQSSTADNDLTLHAEMYLKKIDSKSSTAYRNKMDYQEKYLDARFQSLDDKFGRIEADIQEFRKDVKEIIALERSRTDAINSRIDQSHARIDNLKFWIIGTALALLAAVIGVMQIQNSWVIDSVNRIESSVSQIKTQPPVSPQSLAPQPK